MKKLLTFGLLGIVASISLATMVSGSTVFATIDPNTVGKVTSQANQEYREAGTPNAGGKHASNPIGTSPNDVGCGEDPGRCGLALRRNDAWETVGGTGTQQPGPQGTIEFVCDATSFTAPGCSAIVPP